MEIRVMVIDEKPERSAAVEVALSRAGYRVAARVGAHEDLSARVRAVQPDVIIVDLESPGRDTLEHMRSIGRDCPRPIVMFTQDGDSETIRAAVQAGVSAYVVDGLRQERIRPVLEVATARFYAFQALRHERDQAQASLAARKRIERAKGIVMRQRGCSEEEAHRALRKLAMDRNKRLGEVAEELIASAQLLNAE
jgi:two-component system, response regulator / RNA-binding antiterminator